MTISTVNLIDGLNDEQKQAVLNPINTCTKIVAGAGTGKTKIISKRYVKLCLDLLKDGVETPLENLLVITFTEKAATEMRERIFKELQDGGIQTFAQEDWISTIHSFCSRILRAYSIEANLSPAFKLGDEKQLRDIFDGLIKKITYGEYKTIEDIDTIAEYLGVDSSILSAESLNTFNRINDLEKVLADIFGIIQKVKSLGKYPKEFMQNSIESIQNFTDTVKTLPLDFTNKEDIPINWEKHLKRYISPDCEFYFVKESETGKISYDGVYKEIQKIAFFNCRKKNPMEWNRVEDFPKCLDEISEVEILLTKVIAFVYALYQNELEKRDLADFDDLINKTLFILENNADIRNYYQGQFKHIIVDEFQDTNGAQLRLLVDLLNNDYPNITFVGDKKQSIYLFRHAQMENLDSLHSFIEKKYSKRYEPIELKYNYRSTPQVLEAVNHVTREELSLNEILSANPTIKFEPIEDSVKTSLLGGFENSAEYKVCEAKYIASEIIKTKSVQGLNYKDFAVLVTSHAQADILEQELLKYGIPSIKKSNTTYFKKPVIRNLQAILKFMDNIRDEISLVRVLKIYFSEREIYELRQSLHSYLDEEKDLNFCEQISKLIEDKKLSELDVQDILKEFILNIFDANYKIQEFKRTSSLLQIYHEILKTILPYNNLFGADKLLAENDIKIFEKIIVDYMETTGYVTLKTFNEYVDKIKSDKNFEVPSISNSEVDAVNLLTIHASKGLEYPYVFVANLKNKTSSDKGNVKFDLSSDDYGYGIVINSYMGKENPKHIIYKNLWNRPKLQAEQKRLFYVAVSRAKKFLNVMDGHGSASYVVDMPFHTDEIDVNNITVEKQPLANVLVTMEVDAEYEKANILKTETVEVQKMSFSKMNTFAHCQNKFLLKYKYGYPEMSDGVDYSFVGSVVHNLIYHSFLGKKSLENIEDVLVADDIDETQLSEIKAIYEEYKHSSYSPEKVTGLSEHNFTYEYGGASFTGDIDLVVDNGDGTVNIVDFKTNKDLEKSIFDYSKQLYIYKSALEKEGYKVKDTILLNLRPEGAKEVVVSEKELAEAKLAIDSDIESILNFDGKTILKPEFNPYCKTCAYNYICKSH